MCWLLKGVIPTSRKAYFLMYQDVQPNQPERADHNILYHVAKRLVFLNFRADGVRILSNRVISPMSRSISLGSFLESY